MHWWTAEGRETKVKSPLNNVGHATLKLPLVRFISGLAGLGGPQATPKHIYKTAYRHDSGLVC